MLLLVWKRTRFELVEEEVARKAQEDRWVLLMVWERV